jgi:O-methyltransferase
LLATHICGLIAGRLWPIGAGRAFSGLGRPSEGIQILSDTAISRAPRHLGRITKKLGVAIYNWLWFRIERIDADRERRASTARSVEPVTAPAEDAPPKEVENARPINQVFAPQYISLADAAKFSEFLECGYRDEHILKAMAQKIAGYTMVGYQGIATLIDQARYCEEENIPGAFVEIGTHKGGCLGAMAHANLVFGRSRREIHGFDSFEGIPKPRADKDDMGWATTHMKMKIDDCDGTLQPANNLIAARSDVEELFENIHYPRDHLHLHVGWFQDTVAPAAAEIGPIAILRLDGDLYDSYVIPLENLWDLVVPGGFIVFDDWILKGCRDAVTEFFQKRGIRSYLSSADYSVRYLQKTF